MEKKRLTEDRRFVLFYRAAALLLAAWGIIIHTIIIGGHRWYISFLTYTVQSNILVVLFFATALLRTIGSKDEGCRDFGFYPGFSFAAMIDILLTMLIFWVVLAPNNWAGLNMTGLDNLMVHLFTPLLIFGDRIMFYRRSDMKKKELLYMLIFPYIYIIESSFMGMKRLILFNDGSQGGSYYLYPFLNFDRLGGMVFVNIILLTVFFMGIGYVIFKIEKKYRRT